jgi:hypothetical protein
MATEIDQRYSQIDVSERLDEPANALPCALLPMAAPLDMALRQNRSAPA